MTETADAARRRFDRRMALSFGASFVTVGVFQPFFPVWLAWKGLTAAEIGIVLASQIALRVLASPLVLRRADRARDRANVLVALSFATAASASLLAFADGFAAILAATVLLAMVWASVIPLTDAIALSGVRRFASDYGRARLWGSIAFMVASIAAGVAINGQGPQWFLPLLVASFLGAAVLTLATPRVGVPRRASPPPLAPAAEPWVPARPFWSRRPSLRPLPDVRRLLPVLLAIALIQSSHALLNGFASIRWLELGFGPTVIGTLWAIGVLAEITLFRFSGRLVARFGLHRLLIVAGSAAVLRWLLFPLDLGIGAFALLQALHALTFGATHTVLQSLIAGAVAEERLASVQGTAFAVQTVAMAGATFAAGASYAAFGAGAFMLMAALALAGLCLAALSGRLLQPQSAGRGGETVEEA